MTEKIPEMEKKILQFFKDSYPKDFSIQEVADTLGVHRSTVKFHFNVLKRLKKITLSRKIGAAKLYIYNKESET